MIAVIDTNHLLRLAATMDRSPLFAAWRNGRFELVVSAEILAELDEVARRPKT
jgi:predicted nucleic acid-binding protein